MPDRTFIAIFALFGVCAIHGLRAQAPQTPLANTSVDHVGIVVADIDKASQAFRDVFGVTVPAAREVGPLALRGNIPNAAASRIRLTSFTLGNLGIEMMQPTAGPGPHRDHLDRFGQGMQHVGFLVKEQQKAIDYLVSRGGVWTNGSHVNMKEILGLTAEMKLPPAGDPPRQAPQGPQTPMSNPVVTHIGIVVRDIDKTSRQFSEIFGVQVPTAREVGPLPFPVNAPPNAASSRIRFTQFSVGTMTFELIQPVAGPGPHPDHLETFGQGLHHLAFTARDQKAGIEFLRGRGGAWTIAPYVDMKDILGFTVELMAP